ncbi:MAG: YifB family Mg chelatase-like AAA ATPase [Lachnospiraceae bacterium]|jgi:magnesium chelatase family protein|nr:YifB family Mg chelatase-like AAA ATPase [Lachnospiraceae bacterium]
MYFSVKTSVLHGIDSMVVSCESDVSNGMPVFLLVGFLSEEVKESRERVRTALSNIGISLPAKRITVNISPASIKKSGTSFDLPIAISIIGAMGMIQSKNLDRSLMLGEMNLQGNILPVNGVLPAALSCKENGIDIIIVPDENKKEASLVPGLKVIPVKSISDLIVILKSPLPDESDIYYKNSETEYSEVLRNIPDFKNVKGQRLLRRALEIAVSGMHNILISGPPGAGKTLAAKCVPSILPPMTEPEKILISKIYSAAGIFREESSLLSTRPFRSPHHSVSKAGLAGGGRNPMPGEITLATGGVLFLDELPEFSRDTLEVLRQPLESHDIYISRVGQSVTFPADFMLIASMNPCPCGYFPDLNKCHCNEPDIRRYMKKLSGPLLDRIDMTTSVKALSFDELKNAELSESSSEIYKRIEKVMDIQKKRFKGTNILFNSRIPAEKIEKYCVLSENAALFAKERFIKLELSARSYHKILKIGRTIADSNGHEYIENNDLKEAFLYRDLTWK